MLHIYLLIDDCSIICEVEFQRRRLLRPRYFRLQQNIIFNVFMTSLVMKSLMTIFKVSRRFYPLRTIYDLVKKQKRIKLGPQVWPRYNSASVGGTFGLWVGALLTRQLPTRVKNLDYKSHRPHVKMWWQRCNCQS